jgi:hypothetical protein
MEVSYNLNIIGKKYQSITCTTDNNEQTMTFATGNLVIDHFQALRWLSEASPVYSPSELSDLGEYIYRLDYDWFSNIFCKKYEIAYMRNFGGVSVLDYTKQEQEGTPIILENPNTYWTWEQYKENCTKYDSRPTIADIAAAGITPQHFDKKILLQLNGSDEKWQIIQFNSNGTLKIQNTKTKAIIPYCPLEDIQFLSSQKIEIVYCFYQAQKKVFDVGKNARVNELLKIVYDGDQKYCDEIQEEITVFLEKQIKKIIAQPFKLR